MQHLATTVEHFLPPDLLTTPSLALVSLVAAFLAGRLTGAFETSSIRRAGFATFAAIRLERRSGGAQEARLGDQVPGRSLRVPHEIAPR